MAREDKPTWPIVLLARNRRAVIFCVHLVLFVVALLSAFLLRFDFQWTYPGSGADRNWVWLHFLPALPMVLAIKLGVFGLFRLYEGWWRYAGFKDLLAVLKGAYVSTVIFFLLVYAQHMAFAWFAIPELVSRLPRSIYLLDLGLTIALVGGVRMAVRLWYEEMRPVASAGVTRMLIVGAGNAGTGMLREINRMTTERYRVVGFIDDDPIKQGARIMGIEVLGGVEQLAAICADRRVEEILIAIPSASRSQLQRIVDECQGANIRFRTVPAIADLIGGKVSVSQIKEVDINDLLGRDPVQLDREGIAAFVAGKSVLITGAGGSIGSEMCRQVADFSPASLVLVEQAENNLFFVERELRDKWPDLRVTPYVCDITDRTRVDSIFAAERPAVVFHAAAHKHVPLMEANPGEAIKNNVFGTRAVADAAGKHGVGKFVMISTDKAVNPTSIMGCSKRVAEIYIQSLGRHVETQYVTVRFGNVLGSAGSVVPIFKAQIAAGGPVTVTDARMVRYFMTIPEASQLVLQAGAMGAGGEIFVLDMGEPVKIVDLARTMITLSGFRPDEDIAIKVTGRRPGEKLFEELSIEGEDIAATSHPKILTWRNVPYEDAAVAAAFERLAAVRDGAAKDNVIQALQSIVPEFKPPQPGDGSDGEQVPEPDSEPEPPAAEGDPRHKSGPHAAIETG